MNARIVGAALVCLLWTTNAWTQPAPAGAQPPSRAQIIDEMVAAGVAAAKAGVPRPFQTPLGPGGRGQIAAYLIATHSDREGYQALLQALEARGVKQVGATPANRGTTSLAMTGLAPKILGVALETGAITREVNGTSLTFRATPLGVVKALQNQGLADMFGDFSRSALQRHLARISVAASFDASKGPSGGTFAADEHQLTGWSVRAELVNQRDPASSRYEGQWTGLLRSSAPYRAAAEAMDQHLSDWPAFVAWEQALLAQVERVVEAPLATDRNVTAAGARFKTLLATSLVALEKLPKMPAPALAALDVYVAQLMALQTNIDRAYDFIAKGSLLTFDWSTTRDAMLPDLYTATAVWEHALGPARRTALTANAVVNFYRDRPAAAGRRLKSVDAAAQLDHPLGAVLLWPKSTVTVALRLAHLPDDTVAVAPAGTTGSGAAAAAAAATGTAPKGTIAVFQVKLTVPVKDGVKVPLSITASNRTELVKEKDVRASVGVTFDLDTLVGGLLPKR